MTGTETFEPIFRGNEFCRFFDDAGDGSIAIAATKKGRRGVECVRVERDLSTGVETTRPFDRDSGQCVRWFSPLLSARAEWIELPTATPGSWQLGPLHNNAPFDARGGPTVIATRRAWWVRRARR